MRIFYAKVGQKPDLMIYRNWLNLIELVASFKKNNALFIYYTQRQKKLFKLDL
jgi:hypothetical protein